MNSRVTGPVTGPRVSERVIETVAIREDVDPVELETPLYEAIDTEALDAMFATSAEESDPLRVEFTYCGHDLRVTRDDVEVVDAA